MSSMRGALEITTHIGCKNNCIYCPQDVFLKAYAQRSAIRSLTFDMFCCYLAHVPRDVIIIFSGFSEPWLNAECTNMLMYAHQKGYDIMVATTAVGMKPADVDVLKQVPFLRFLLHLPDDGHLTEIPMTDSYYETLARIASSNIMNLCCLYHRRKNGREKPHPAVAAIFTQVPLHHHYLHDRAGAVAYRHVSRQQHRGKKLYPCRFYDTRMLLPNGDVAVCCMDWALENICGNILDGTYHDMCASETFLRIVRGFDDPEADILCRRCAWAETGPSIMKTVRDVCVRIKRTVFGVT